MDPEREGPEGARKSLRYGTQSMFMHDPPKFELKEPHANVCGFLVPRCEDVE